MALNPPLSLPFIFTNGTVADATQVDANFSALLGAANANSRTILPGTQTFYVAPGGIDGGIPTNILTPAATMNYVLGLLESSYDLNGTVGTAVIQLADGTYNESVVIRGQFVGQRTPNQLIIQGNLGSPANVVINGAPAVSCGNSCSVQLQGMRLTSAVSSCLLSQTHANVTFQQVDFGAAVFAQVHSREAGLAYAIGNYSISGSAQFHYACAAAQIYIQQVTTDLPATPGTPTVTLTGAPAFSGAFAQCQDAGLIKVLATFSGAATGSRFSSTNNGVINNGGLANLPGSSAGTTGTGGQYT